MYFSALRAGLGKQLSNSTYTSKRGQDESHFFVFHWRQLSKGKGYGPTASFVTTTTGIHLYAQRNSSLPAVQEAFRKTHKSVPAVTTRRAQTCTMLSTGHCQTIFCKSLLTSACSYF